jgi:hypothetical protein
METLTKSRLHAFRKCKQYHKLAFIDGWRRAQDTEALSFGTLFHAGAEVWWKTGDIEAALSAMRCSDELMLINAQEVLRVYVSHGWPDRNDYDVLAVEHPVRFPLINPETMATSRTYEMGGVLDLVLKRRATSEVTLVEHKTTGADFSDDAADYWKRLDMDPQLSIYVVGCEAAGFKIDRIIYDVVARPQLRVRLATAVEARKYTKDGKLYANQRDTDETNEEFRARLRADIAERPERYTGRREIARMESQVRDGMLDTWQEARFIRDAQLSGRHPRNPDACHQMGTCEMFEICAYGVDPEQSSLFRRTKDLHPELSARQEVNS